jgi:hypothetical protein
VLLEAIDSRITLLSDGWSAKKRTGYNAIGIQYIESDPVDETSWRLRRNILTFEASPGRHTGEEIGKELLKTVKKFNFGSKVS